MHSTLRKGDGFGNGATRHLMNEVIILQKALLKEGYDVVDDGLFGKDTEKVVKAFQSDRGITVDGIVGPATWRALDSALPKNHRTPDFSTISGFETFHGDLNWIHEREGHVGKPYWPGGRSGVTFDPGFDLAHQTMDMTRLYYGDLLSNEQDRAVQNVIGLHGREAKQALETATILKSIRVSRSKALKIMPHIAVKYWKPVVRRFSGIDEMETPGSVQTVMLSLAYNRGSGNRDLEDLKTPIAARRWLEVADAVGSMQQDHELRGIRIRRRMEADLIRQEVDFG